MKDNPQTVDVDRIAEILEKGGSLVVSPLDQERLVAAALSVGAVTAATRIVSSQYVPEGTMVAVVEGMLP